MFWLFSCFSFAVSLRISPFNMQGIICIADKQLTSVKVQFWKSEMWQGQYLNWDRSGGNRVPFLFKKNNRARNPSNYILFKNVSMSTSRYTHILFTLLHPHSNFSRGILIFSQFKHWTERVRGVCILFRKNINTQFFYRYNYYVW